MVEREALRVLIRGNVLIKADRLRPGHHVFSLLRVRSKRDCTIILRVATVALRMLDGIALIGSLRGDSACAGGMRWLQALHA